MQNGTTPAYIASQNGHTETLALLLASKADIKNGTTLAFIASQNGHTQTLALLLANKADINAAYKVQQFKIFNIYN
jgi:ankyrin repeat protein